MSPEIEFTRFREAFGIDPGVLPDGEVLGSTRQDWVTVVAILQGSGWRLTHSDGVTPLPRYRHEIDSGDTFAVWLAEDVRVNFFPGPDGVLFDVDLRELGTQPTMDALADLLRLLGTNLRRDVVILDESAGDPPILRYSAETDQFTLS